MAPWRVFHLIKSLGRGGAEVLLAQAIPYRGSEFRYEYGYFLPWKNAIVPALRASGAEVICFRAGTLLLAWRLPQVVHQLRQSRADLLHGHLPLAAVVGRLAARAAGIPMVYTEHNLMRRYHPVTRWLNLLTWGMQDLVIAVSTEVAADIRRYRPGGPPVEVVPNGVCLRTFRPDPARGREVRSRLDIPPEAPVVGTVAVFRVQKRLDLWLEIAREIKVLRPDAHFVLVGDGPLREELTACRRRLDLQDSVRFTGLQEDVRPYFDALDVFLMTSRFEGLPVALLEAMAMEKAVVASPVGGIPEVIDHGATGLLMEPSSKSELVERVCELLADRELSRRLGENARARVERDFSVQAMVARTESLYRRVLASRKPC